MRYLTVEQSLGDIAYFIRFLRNNIFGLSESRVILIGFGYHGSLATWFSSRYPDLVSGVWAASAPLVAEFNNTGYLARVGDFIADSSEQCFNRIRSGIEFIEDTLDEGNEENIATMLAKLPLCTPMNTSNSQEVALFFYTLSQTLTAYAK